MNQTEKQFEAGVVKYARLNGWRVYHTYDSSHSTEGFPDLTMVRGCSLLFIELKTEKGKVSLPQREWIDALAVTKADVWVWRPSDWDLIEAVLSR